MARNYKQGMFVPKFPQKYAGDHSKVIFRSSWEYHFMRYCDMNENVISWSSEEIVVPYYFDIDGKNHRYFVDFWMKVKKPDGSIETLLIEIKPKGQIIKPKVKKMNKSNEEKVLTWLKNQCKWKAAEEFARQRGWTFRVLAEDDLGIKF